MEHTVKVLLWIQDMALAGQDSKLQGLRVATARHSPTGQTGIGRRWRGVPSDMAQPRPIAP